MSDQEPDKKKRKKMPSAPILAPNSNVKGIGKFGLFTGGPVPGLYGPSRQTGPQAVATFMKGYNSKTRK